MNTGLYVGEYVLQHIVLFSGQVMHQERLVIAQGVETSAQPLIKTHWGRDKNLADDIFKYIFLNENVSIPIKSLFLGSN